MESFFCKWFLGYWMSEIPAEGSQDQDFSNSSIHSQVRRQPQSHVGFCEKGSNLVSFPWESRQHEAAFPLGTLSSH